MKKKQKIVLLASVLSVASVSQSYGAGYSSSLYSTSGLANSYAGSVTASHDASDLFFNPAASASLESKQAIISASYLNLQIDPDSTSAKSRGGNVAGGDMSDSGKDLVVPAIYFSSPINDKTSFGFAVTAPFGLATSYKDNWVGRYQALDSAISTFNFNPSLSYKICDKLSIGAGVEAQYYQATLTKAYDLGTSDGFVKAKGTDWGYGYNLGATYQLNKKIKFGLGYRSKIDHKIMGTVQLANAGANSASADFDSRVTTPESLTFGASYKFDDKLELAYDGTWTRWSRLKSMTINSGNPNLNLTENYNWHDSLLNSVGANYKTNDQLLMRAGLAYEKDAVNNINRNPRIPNGDKIWTSIGFNYKLDRGFSIDGTYMHQFFRKTTSNIDDGSGNTLTTKYKTKVDIISVALKKEF